MNDATPTWRIEVDRERCMGTAGCVHTLPRVFQLGEDGLAYVAGSANDAVQLLEQVVGECPTAALRLTRFGDTDDAAAARPDR